MADTNTYIIIGIITGIVFVAIGIIYLKYFKPYRLNESGFEYVYVNDDGIVRELFSDEIEYLKEEFHPSDGGRPYIKYRYKSLTPNKSISGFIKRKRVPKEIEIKNVVQHRV